MWLPAQADAVAIALETYTKFLNENPALRDTHKIVGGVFEGQVFDLDGVEVWCACSGDCLVNDSV
jgi:hypothetical protein